MLFRQRDHAAIEAGTISMTVRAWRRSQARVGGSYRLHARGVIVVDELALVAAAALSDDDAARCGYASVGQLLADLAATTAGRAPVEELTRLAFHYEPKLDERGSLALDDTLADDELEQLAERLEAMDRRSHHGAWTLGTLRLIDGRPRVVASKLAASLGRETRPFKADVRKLKALGLTISHDVGYGVSPRGKTLLEYLRRSRDAR